MDVICFFFLGVICLTATALEVRLASFNAGLTPKNGYYNDRRDETVFGLQELNTDVLCLQEVWYSRDLTRIVEELKTTYPYSFSAIHDEVSTLPQISPAEAPCLTGKFLFNFMPCLAVHCLSSMGTDIEYLSCAMSNCGLLDLEQPCITCLVLTDSSSHIQRCLLDVGNRFNVPGLLLLSKLPLERANITRFEPDRSLLLPRAYIEAQVGGVGKVICTHMAANLGTTYFENLQFTSWGDQNEAQARALLQLLASTDRVVVMGDINSSPAIPVFDVEEDIPGAFNLFSQGDFDTPYTSDVGICTFCKYNPLVNTTHNQVLDHIFTRNFNVISALRVLDDVRVRGKYPLSDHYGIEVIVKAPYHSLPTPNLFRRRLSGRP